MILDDPTSTNQQYILDDVCATRRQIFLPMSPRIHSFILGSKNKLPLSGDKRMTSLAKKLEEQMPAELVITPGGVGL
jgi:hypothetical protein